MSSLPTSNPVQKKTMVSSNKQQDPIGLSKDTASFRQEIHQVKSDVAEVKSDVAEVKYDVEKVKSDVKKVKSDIAEVKSDIAQVKSDVAEVKSDVARLQNELNVGLISIKELVRYQVRQLFAKFNSKIDKIQSQLDNINKSSSIVRSSSSSSSLKMNFSDIRKEIQYNDKQLKLKKRSLSISYVQLKKMEMNLSMLQQIKDVKSKQWVRQHKKTVAKRDQILEQIKILLEEINPRERRNYDQRKSSNQKRSPSNSPYKFPKFQQSCQNSRRKPEPNGASKRKKDGIQNFPTKVKKASRSEIKMINETKKKPKDSKK